MAQALLTNTFLQGKSVVPFRPLTAKKVRNPGIITVTCRKKDIHPKFYEDAKVYCNGELVMTTGGTRKEYSVDVWSGNHPFYRGDRSTFLMDADQVDKFRKKFSDLSQIMEIPVLSGEVVIPSRRKGIKPKGGKKK